ncbi:MbtH family protein [Burkholderia stagnalis]
MLRKTNRSQSRPPPASKRARLYTIKDITLSIDQQSLPKEYFVVLNGEDQYSIWPTSDTLPGGWFDAGKRGSREECLEYIDQVWVDMRPRSLRDMTSISGADIADVSKV